MDKRNQLENLKIKNKKSIVCKEWNNHGIEISFDNFINVSKTLGIQDMILAKLDYMDKEMKTIIYPLNKEFISEYIKILNKIIKRDCLYVYYQKESTKIGAIQLSGKDILDNIYFLMDESELQEGCSFFLTTKDCTMGCCIWLTEYDRRIYVW